jgi:hypothetical protein
MNEIEDSQKSVFRRSRYWRDDRLKSKHVKSGETCQDEGNPGKSSCEATLTTKA